MKILSLGDILWDVYPTEKYIGGAPLNFAAHLATLGEEVFMLSAVGNDQLGMDALEYLKAKSINNKYVSVLDLPTGRSLITMDEKGIPTFNLLTGVAFDNIPYLPITEKFDVLYFGSLTLRSENNKTTLQELLKANEFGEIFVDINIRPPYYSDENINYSVSKATIIKISLEEMPVVAEALGIDKNLDYKDFSNELTKQFSNLRYILITLGDKGAFALDCHSRNEYFCDSVKTEVVSTVGAGDSFSAAFLHKYFKNENIENCLEFASKIAGFVVSKYDAVPEYKATDFE